jgi:hypothetical protein
VHLCTAPTDSKRLWQLRVRLGVEDPPPVMLFVDCAWLPDGVSGQLMADRRIALALRPILPVADLSRALRDLRTSGVRVTLNKAQSHSAMKSAP